jgi:hypothetical protein
MCLKVGDVNIHYLDLCVLICKVGTVMCGSDSCHFSLGGQLLRTILAVPVGEL